MPARRTAVLLCNPFGQEAIFAHRILRVMADRLSRGGFHVMRFDYFATGDSSGDCEEGTLARWVDDVNTASDELVDTAGVQSVAWVGLRLGATIAALASAQRSSPLSALVLWEPVVLGLAYLEELRRAHLKLIAEDLPFPPPHPFGVGTAASIEIDQALGFAVSQTLRQEFCALETGRLAAVRARRVFVVSGLETEDLKALKTSPGRLTEQASWNLLGQSEAWNSEQALNSSVIPAGALNAVIGCLEEPR
jgi:pimeloyl-ACP methyl ester carboxylesterase